MFGFASFYIVHATTFVEVMMALLIVDMIWTVAAGGVAPHQKLWFLNNLIHFVAIAVCFGFHIRYKDSPVPFYFAAGLLLTNGLVDFVWNRAFYFSDRVHEKALFLSAPFTQLLANHRFSRMLSAIASNP